MSKIDDGNCLQEVGPRWSRGGVAGIGEEAASGFLAGLYRVRSWRVPPNWSVFDWHEELQGIALAAAWQAEQEHDPSREVPLAGFVFARVQSRALTRFRQEWRYALRISPDERAVIEAEPATDPAAELAGAVFDSLDQAVRQLPEMERWLLDQLYWRHRTEAAIAAELQISQPAVNKRKQAALVHLRALL